MSEMLKSMGMPILQEENKDSDVEVGAK